jgi:hypothetical protein
MVLGSVHRCTRDCGPNRGSVHGVPTAAVVVTVRTEAIDEIADRFLGAVALMCCPGHSSSRPKDGR